MKSNSILEDLWRIKDDLAREAGYDVQRLCENARPWAAAHPHPGPRVRNAEELQRVWADLDRAGAEDAALVLNDAPPIQS